MRQQFNHIHGGLAAFGHGGDIDADFTVYKVMRMLDAFGVTRTFSCVPTTASSESAPFFTMLVPLVKVVVWRPCSKKSTVNAVCKTA